MLHPSFNFFKTENSESRLTFSVTPDFPKKTKCISYVRQDQVYTHMIDVMSEISINSNKNRTRVKPLHYLFITLRR
jgi:hypothetical protein